MLRIELTDREAGRMVSALRTLRNDHRVRAVALQKEAREIDDPVKASPAQHAADDQRELMGKTEALLERLQALM